MRCDGAYDIIKSIADECENEYLKKEAQEREKREEEERRLEAGLFLVYKIIAVNFYLWWIYLLIEAAKQPWERVEQPPAEPAEPEKKEKKKKKKKSSLIFFQLKLFLVLKIMLITF